MGNFSIRAYTVHFRQLGKANSKENQDVVSKGTHSFEVKRLLGYTNYSLYVKAYTKTIGKPSETIVQRTRQDRKLISFLIIITLLVTFINFTD